MLSDPHNSPSLENKVISDIRSLLKKDKLLVFLPKEEGENRESILVLRVPTEDKLLVQYLVGMCLTESSIPLKAFGKNSSEPTAIPLLTQKLPLFRRSERSGEILHILTNHDEASRRGKDRADLRQNDPVYLARRELEALSGAKDLDREGKGKDSFRQLSLVRDESPTSIWDIIPKATEDEFNLTKSEEDLFIKYVKGMKCKAVNSRQSKKGSNFELEMYGRREDGKADVELTLFVSRVYKPKSELPAGLLKLKGISFTLSNETSTYRGVVSDDENSVSFGPIPEGEVLNLNADKIRTGKKKR